MILLALLPAFVLGAAGLIFTGYFGKTKLDAVLYLSVSVGCSAMAMAGFNINHIDLAPRYAGILMGITNLVATIPGIVAPLVAKVIAKEVCHITKVYFMITVILNFPVIKVYN